MKRIAIILFLMVLVLVGTASADYTLPVEALTNSPADSVTNYLGNNPAAPSTLISNNTVYIPVSGIITMAEIYDYSGTAGSAQAYSYYIRINNANDYLISTLSVSASERVFTNTGMNLAVNAGDYFEIKRVHPLWTPTNPATNIVGGYIYINTSIPGYTLWGQGITNSPADSVINYFGTKPGAPVTNAGRAKIYVPANGTITAINVRDFSGTAGTAETYGYRFNKNGGAAQFVQNLTASTNLRNFANYTESTSVVKGDYIEFSRIHPAWVTNPLTNIVGATAFVNMTGSIDPKGYLLHVQALTSSPTDTQTVYFGNLPKVPQTSAAMSKVYIRNNGTIRRAEVYTYSGTAGTAESWSMYVRKNNTQDYLISTIAAAASERRFTNTSINISVVAGDYIEIKGIQPTWATNPLTTIYGGYLWIEYPVAAPASAIPPMGKLVNAYRNLSISTYDGSYVAISPSVIYTSTAWNGYHYLMSMAPYPNMNPVYENPSMRYSNDGYTWVQISGQPDPIITPTTETLSDPNLELYNGTLYLFYRTQITSPWQDYISYTTTTNGINWTTPVQMGLTDVLSPSILWNGTGWEAWATEETTGFPLRHYYTSSLTPINFISSGNCTGINEGMPGYTQRHSNIKINNGQYQMLMSPVSEDQLFYFNSTDGKAWIGSEANPVLTNRSSKWDKNLFVSSFVYSNNYFKVWYHGYDKYGTGNGGIGLTDDRPGKAGLALTLSHAGYVGQTTDAGWYTMRNGAGESISNFDPLADEKDSTLYVGTSSTINIFDELQRILQTYNGAPIPDNAVIDDALVYLKGHVKSNGLGSLNISIIDAIPADALSYVAGDYDGTTFTRLAPDIPYIDFSTTGWSQTWLNPTGISKINKTGNFTFMFAFANDVDNSSPIGTASQTTQIKWWAYYYGPSPEVDIMYHLVYIPVSAFSCTPLSGSSSLSVACTDTSTNLPNTWAWYNNSTLISTEQNPTFTLGIGTHDIKFYTSNEAGGDWENKTSYITVSNGSLAPVAHFTTAKSLYRIPGSLQVNDTSTNTPTIWNWSWGDGTWTNGTTVTEQNATHKYTTRGKFSVTLLCSNAFGANTTPSASPVRIVGYENYW